MTRLDLPSPPERVLVIGPRELDVLRLLWEHGATTASQIHAWLVVDTPLAYSTVQTICVHLTTKGLLTRRRATRCWPDCVNGS